MRITIDRNGGAVGVDGVLRNVDVSTLPRDVYVIQYDTSLGRGVIQYDQGATVSRGVRDAEAEHQAALEAGNDRQKIAALVPLYKKILVTREPEEFTDFTPYQPLVDAWGAAGVPKPASTAEQRLAIDLDRDKTLSEGNVSWNARRWHIDQNFQLHLTGYIAAFEAGIVPAASTVPVRSFDDEVVQLGFFDLKALSSIVLQAVQQVWVQSWAKKDALV